jgi:DivIVA domain-containing protein
MLHNQGVTDPAPSEPTDLPEPELRSTKPWSRGYRQSEVDAFVTELRRAYAHQPPTMAPYEVADQHFAPTRFGKGYTMRSVDAYLERAQEQLRERHGGDAVAGVHGRETPQRHKHFPTELIYVAAGVVILALVVFLALTQF